MKRHAITLAVLVVSLMEEFNILNFDRDINLEEL